MKAQQLKRWWRVSTGAGLAILVAMLVVELGGAWAQTATAAKMGLALTTSSTLRLEGDSNVHKWSSVASVMRVSGSFGDAETPDSPEALWNAVRAGQPVRAELRIPVDGLKSGKDKLDANLVKALRGNEYPEIVYKLEKYQAKAAGDSMLVTLTGKLSVAGKDQPHAMTVSLRPEAAGLRLKGHTELTMTQFGIKPPTMMLGTLRTHDDVVVLIDLVIKPAAGGVK